MNRFLSLSFVSCLLALVTQAQPPIPAETSLFTPYDTAVWNAPATQRVADIGKLWGALKYFHPQLMKGTLQADQLLLKTLDPLLDNPSKANFVRTIQSMLRLVGDTTTQIESAPSIMQSARAKSGKPARPLPATIGYIALPQERFTGAYSLDSFLTAPQLTQPYWMIDLRNQAENERLGLQQYTAFVQPLVAGLIDRTLILPTLRTAYYHAYLRQNFSDDLDVIPARDRGGDPNYWYQERFGLKNTSQGAYLLKGKSRFRGKRFCFIVNQYNNANTLKALLALRNRNGCYLLFEGPIPDYLKGDYYTLPLADQVRVKIKVGEQIYEDGTLGTPPDRVLQAANLLTTDELIQYGRVLFQKPPQRNPTPIANTVYIRLPQPTYSDTLYPNRKLRLAALFNFWNVIHYFCPNKPLIRGNWDTLLSYFAPRFLFARDYKSYYWLLRELSARLNDGHAEVLYQHGVLPPPGINEFYAPFCIKYIEGKTILVQLIADSTHRAANLQVGDQLIAIDGIAIDTLYQRWQQYEGSSNESSYRDVLHKIPLVSRSGPQPFAITIMRAGQPLTMPVAPVAKSAYLAAFRRVYYPAVPKPYWRSLNDSTGYVRVNSIYSTQVDSVWQALKGRKYIILDARGYPRDEAIVATLAAPFMSKIDTVCINAFPEITHPVLSRNAVTLEAEMVSPLRSYVTVDRDKRFVLLCGQNASQAETNIIAWQKVLHPTTIGLPTVGANGVSNTILMAGGYESRYSGFAVYYPDGTPNQRLGVKIDLPVSLTIQGVLGGQDEVLQRALLFIEQQRR
ncbi:S41 family peptidase [Spirosoma pulveris]